MMEKYRVHEVAKDLGVPSKEIIELLGQYFSDTKKHMTALEPNELSVIFEHYTSKNAVDSFDTYFADAQKKKEEAAAKALKIAKAQEAEKAAQAARAPKQVKQPTQQPLKAPQQRQPASAQPAQQARPAAQQGQQRPPQAAQRQPAAQQRPQGQGQNRPAANQNQGRPRPQQQQRSRAEQPRQVVQHRPQAQPQQNPTQVVAATENTQHVDMRTVKVNLDKYNERYETIAPTNLAKKDTGVRKQKLNQRSAQRGKPFMSRKDKELQKMQRLEMERQRRQKLDITIPEEIAVSELAARLKVQASEVVKRLMGLGVMASAGEIIDYDTAAMVAMEIGAKVSPEVVVTIEERLFDEAVDTDENLSTRPPIVVVMGHV
ncbi:MAG: translation initiation factor IF-2 N-terminal domain-containing protein, partial [Oscillospiraceae bacterium]|nr:translation initiation factor IF-2 N-terminal domain-containing protein [Oscillospiraceae bacterium]